MIDLHCHYVPAVDDGVRDFAQGVALCQALASIGYQTVVATPHIRSGMFDNRKADLVRAFEAFAQEAKEHPKMPGLGLGAEHFCDDVFFTLFARGDTLPYPGGHAALIELPPDRMPVNIEALLFRLSVRGVKPVIAHPERYTPLFRDSEPLTSLVERGVLAQLDLMSLTGKYGRKAEKAAERMLDEGLYYLACSDSHKPADVELVQHGIARLVELLGENEAQLLLCEHPRSILEGTVQD